MCLMAGGYLLLLLRLWPRVFLRRFPEEVRNAVPPLTSRERGLGFAVTLPLLIMLLGFPVWIAAHLHGLGVSGFGVLFTASFAVWMMFNLFDWLILDELVVGRLRPSWLVLPGAEQVPLRFDRAEHARSFVKGSVGGVIICALIAAGVLLVG